MSTSHMLNKGIKRMPTWVNEQTGRIGPKPPPPPPENEDNRQALTPEPIRLINNKSNGNANISKSPKSDPDYEVIEFSSQQYSNEAMIHNKGVSKPPTPDTKLKCSLCGSNNPWVICESCCSQIFCASCDDMFHKHPKRREHVRKAVEQSRPPLPPKASGSPMPPIAPPRRHKRGLPTPLLSRKDQMNGNNSNFQSTRNVNHMAIPPSPTPSKSGSIRSASSVFNLNWTERMNSLKRGGSTVFNNRPLPDIPKPSTPLSDNASSRSTTPKSVFDNIQRPPSVTLEKIRSKANATLDRMTLLQQRYRQHVAEQEDRSKNGKDENVSFDHWSSLSSIPSHIRSGSMSSGLNSSHFDQMDESQFHLFNQRQQLQQAQQQMSHRSGGVNGNLNRRGMSSSVFNLNQINRPVIKPQPTPWMGSIQQAQSMAQLNCGNVCHLPPSGFCGGQPLNNSNLSLNVGNNFARGNMQYPPPAFMNQPAVMSNMYPYPYPYGMPPQPGFVNMGVPQGYPMNSRPASRLASPAMSRKSLSLRRKRNSYADDDATDDEDSEEDDRRSIVSNRSALTNSSRIRSRRLSSASQMLNEDFEISSQKNLRNKYRNQRRPSIPKSLQGDWTPDAQTPRQVIHRKDSSISSPTSKIYSDLDSEGSTTKALIQAKIQQKVKENSLKEKSAKKVDQGTDAPDIVKIKSSRKYQDSEKIAESTLSKTVRQEIPKINKTQVKSNESEPEPESEEAVESEDESHKEDEKDIQNKFADGAGGDPEIVEDELGPPPSTPDYEWICEFCTFVNEPKVKICAICCKTPSAAALRKRSPPESILKTKASIDSSNTSIIANDMNNLQIVNTKKDSITQKRNDSLEHIWSKLESDIKDTAHEVAKKVSKVSKSSPEKLLSGRNNIFSENAPSSEVSSRSSQGRDVSLERIITVKETGTSPPPQSISTQTYDTVVVKTVPSPETEIRKSLEKTPESDAPKFTVEEFQIALKYSGGTMDPMQWLRENWHKLIQTVQNLATLYGQELTENTIGTISQQEAREALKLSGGNVWQAISQCIEDRRKKYTYLTNKGQFLREDVVSALTTHQGNVDLALMDLERNNLKPFLMRIWGSPGGVENDSSPAVLQKSSFTLLASKSPFEIINKKETQESNAIGMQDSLISHHSSDNLSEHNSQYPSINNNQADQYHLANTKDRTSNKSPFEDMSSNPNVLKDLENIINNLERNQATQSQQVIQTIEGIIENFNKKKELSVHEDFAIQAMRSKSPIFTPKVHSKTDIKSFVWQHIQEIVPSLVQQVEMELLEKQVETVTEDISVEGQRAEPPPVDPSEYIMKELIEPNLKTASIREDAPPHIFSVEYLNDFERELTNDQDSFEEDDHGLMDLQNAPRDIYYSYLAPSAKILEVSEPREEKQHNGTAENTYDSSDVSTIQSESSQSFIVMNGDKTVASKDDLGSETTLDSSKSENIEENEVVVSTGYDASISSSITSSTSLNPTNKISTVETSLEKDPKIHTSESAKKKIVSKIPVRKTFSTPSSPVGKNLFFKHHKRGVKQPTLVLFHNKEAGAHPATNKNENESLSQGTPRKSMAVTNSKELGKILNCKLAPNNEELVQLKLRDGNSATRNASAANTEALRDAAKSVSKSSIDSENSLSDSNETNSTFDATEESSELQPTPSDSHSYGSFEAKSVAPLNECIVSDIIHAVQKSDKDPARTCQSEQRTSRKIFQKSPETLSSLDESSDVNAILEQKSLECLSGIQKSRTYNVIPNYEILDQKNLERKEENNDVVKIQNEGNNYIGSSSETFEDNEVATGGIETGGNKTGGIETGRFETGEIESGEIESGEIESGEIETGEFESDDIETGEIETGETETGETETGETETDEIESDEIESDEFDSDEVEEAQVIDIQVADIQVADTQVVDTQVVDTQVVDTQVVDTQVVDTQVVDTQVVDTQVVDTQVADTQVADTQVADTQVADTQVADTQVADTQVADTQVADTQVADTQVADTQVADTQVADTQVADTQVADTQVADTQVADTQVADTQVADTQVADTQVADTQVADTQVADTQVADTQVADTQVADTQVADTQVADTQVADTQVADTQVADTQVADTQVADTQVVDTQVVDTQVVDTQVVDTQVVDTQVVDTQVVDTQVVDTQVVDTQVVDTQVVDTQVVDTQVVDTQVVDTQVVDEDHKELKEDYDPEENIEIENENEEAMTEMSNSKPSTSSTEFKFSSDPSKQNLTDLVADTQRLIKQMRDEINEEDLDSYDYSGEDSENYSDENFEDDECYYEEYDEEEEYSEGEVDELIDTEEDTNHQIQDSFNEDDDAFVDADSGLNSQYTRELSPNTNQHINEHSKSENEIISFTPNPELVSQSQATNDINGTSIPDEKSSVNVEGELLKVSEYQSDEPETDETFEEADDQFHEVALVSDETENQETKDVTNLDIQNQQNEDHQIQVTPQAEPVNDSLRVIDNEDNKASHPVVSNDVTISLKQSTEDKKLTLKDNNSETTASSYVTKAQDSDTISDLKPSEPLMETPSMTISLNSLRNEAQEVSVEYVVNLRPSKAKQDSKEENYINATANNIPELPVEVLFYPIGQINTDTSDVISPQSVLNKSEETSADVAITENVTIRDLGSKPLGNVASTREPETLESHKDDTNDNDINEDIPSTSAHLRASIEAKKAIAEEMKLNKGRSSLQTKNPKSNTQNIKSTSPKSGSRGSVTKTSVDARSRKISETKHTSSEGDSAVTKKMNNISKIPKPSKNEKLLTRSRSFSVAPAPIGISSVKAIQQTFLSKQPHLTPGPVQGQPSVFRKKSISEAITKFTKSFDTTNDSKKPSTSHGIKFRTHSRIPKKKYHETCFSDDDYETTSEEDTSHVSNDFLTRKQSVPVFQTYPSLVEKDVNPEVLASKYLEEKLVSSNAEAHLVAALVQMKFPEDLSIIAAQECNDLDQAIAFLRQECELCMEAYPMNEIVSMLKCTHKCCKQCAKQYFTVQQSQEIASSLSEEIISRVLDEIFSS